MTDDSARAASRFDALLADYYASWLRTHPEAAVDAGVYDHAHLLSAHDDQADRAIIRLNEEVRSALDEMGPEGLDADRALDFDLVHGAARIENADLLGWAREAVDPSAWIPADAIHQLLIRPVPHRVDAMSARLGAVPGHLQSARDHLLPRAASVPLLWARSAVEEAREGAEFLASLASDPALAADAGQLGAPIRRASESLTYFAGFLEREIVPQARAGFACGARHFDCLLHYGHHLDISADTLHAFGQDLFERTRAELTEACRDLSGSPDPAPVLARLKANRPASGSLLEAYRAAMIRARTAVLERGLVSMPAVERIDVVETPTFLRHQIPFAAYSEPAPNDPGQCGRYYVTPPSSDEEAAEHHATGIAHTSVHEAWPGHHLQFVTAHARPESRTLPRLLNASATLYEGWALYCEQLMQEEGVLDAPESRVVLLHDRLWRALRVMIDVELHTRGLTVEQAADRMVSALGFPRALAMADLTWYTMSPTVPLGYATGWALINALRASVARDLHGAALRPFHDRLLSAGSVALPRTIQRAFGESAWSQARDAIFGGRGNAT